MSGHFATGRPMFTLPSPQPLSRGERGFLLLQLEMVLPVAPGSLPATLRVRATSAERASRYPEAYAFNVQQPRLPGVQVSHSKRNPAPSNLP